MRHRITRRSFVEGIALGAAAVALGCEGEMSARDEDGGPMTPGDAGTSIDGGTSGNRAPLWITVPTIHFVVGVAATFSIAEYVSDPDGDELSVVLNDVPLPAGVTYDTAGKQFVYDGTGPVATTTGHELTADDGR